ncbi:hypothetical protein F4861DRAFT_146114 [Xylaria intraflava]|nr:hypothetical protein F4861DRAFT_146114 [Xylaria intraflava]
MSSDQSQLAVERNRDEASSEEAHNAVPNARNNIETPSESKPDQIHGIGESQPFHAQNQPMYITYPGQPNTQFAYVTPARPLPNLSSTYIATRLGLIGLCLVWNIIIIALTSVLLSGAGDVWAVSLYSYAIAAASIIWNTAELITYGVRLRGKIQRGIHPGAHVGLHLIFWLVGIFAILITAADYAELTSAVQVCMDLVNKHPDRSDWYYCDQYEPYDNLVSKVFPLLRAFLAIFSLWEINHFVLFVLGCIETYKRNSLKPLAFVMNVAPPNASQQAGMKPVQSMTQPYPQPILVQPQPAQSTRYA